MFQQVVRHKFDVEAYELMGRTGVLPPDRRTELLEGEIFDLSPIGMAHAACVDFLVAFLSKINQNAFIVRCQNPVLLDNVTQPQPDIALLRPRDDYYRTSRPAPPDVFLVIEIADSSLDHDRQHKLPLYAESGIPEIWIVNLTNQQIEVHSDPADGIYKLTRIFRRGETVKSHQVDKVEVAVDDIFG